MVRCSISTPSWSHCTSSWTTGGSSSTLRNHRESVVQPCLHRSRGHHPGHPRPVAPLQKRARFLALRSSTSALLLPEALFPEPAQPEGALSLEPDLRDFQRGVARTLRGASEVYHVLDTTLIPAIVRLRASRRGLFCGQRPPSGGAPPPDRVGLRVQGGTFCQPGGRDLHLR